MRHPLIAFHARHAASPMQTPLVGGMMHGQEMISHLGGSPLLFLFGQVDTSSQQVHPTQTVRLRILVVDGKPIIHCSSPKARPDADLIHGLPAALREPGQMRQPVRAVHMQLVQFTPDA